MKNENIKILTTLLTATSSLIGCGFFFIILFFLHKIDLLPWLIWFFAFFLCCMVSIFSIIVILGVGFSCLPIWQYLHNLLITQSTEKNQTSTSLAPETIDENPNYLRKTLTLICMFMLLVAGINVFVIGWDIYAYYSSEGDGTVKEITWRSTLILDNEQIVSNPVNSYRNFPNLKPIELGDLINKKSGSDIFFVNGRNYFNKQLMWQQVMNSHSIIFIIVSSCLGLLTATILKICYPKKLLDLADY